MNWKRGHPQKRDDSRGLGEARAKGGHQASATHSNPGGEDESPGLLYFSALLEGSTKTPMCCLFVCLSVFIFLCLSVCLFVCL